MEGKLEGTKRQAMGDKDLELSRTYPGRYVRRHTSGSREQSHGAGTVSLLSVSRFSLKKTHSRVQWL